MRRHGHHVHAVHMERTAFTFFICVLSLFTAFPIYEKQMCLRDSVHELPIASKQATAWLLDQSLKMKKEEERNNCAFGKKI
jgi:hypothetical protein